MYTKGEWKERLVMGEREIYVDHNDENIINEVICRDVRHWNAPIIKAAPDMLEALEGIVADRMMCHETESANIPTYIEAVYKAISKAKGES